MHVNIVKCQIGHLWKKITGRLASWLSPVKSWLSFFWIFSNYSIPPDLCCHIRNFVTSRCISFKCRRFPSVSGWGGGGLNAPAACATLRNDQRGLQSAARLPKWEENSAQVKVGAERHLVRKVGVGKKKKYWRLPTCSTSTADITNPASVLLFAFK